MPPASFGVAATPAQVRAVAAVTGVPTRMVALRGLALVDALDAGHVEAAVLDRGTLRAAIGRMGQRLAILRVGQGGAIVSRRVLPTALHRELAAALA